MLTQTIWIDPRKPEYLTVENYFGRCVRLRDENPRHRKPQRILLSLTEFQGLEDACMELAGKGILGAPKREGVVIPLVPETPKEKKAREKAERQEAERQEAERQEAERQEAERQEAERQEAERLEAERLEAERLEAERLEAERLEAERLEAENRPPE